MELLNNSIMSLDTIYQKTNNVYFYICRSPVSLSKIEKAISTRTGSYDIKLTSKSRISPPVKQLKFRFEEPNNQKMFTINEAKQLNPFQKVNQKLLSGRLNYLYAQNNK